MVELIHLHRAYHSLCIRVYATHSNCLGVHSSAAPLVQEYKTEFTAKRLPRKMIKSFEVDVLIRALQKNYSPKALVARAIIGLLALTGKR